MWVVGPVPAAGLYEVLPTRPIPCRFVDGTEWTWGIDDLRVARFELAEVARQTLAPYAGMLLPFEGPILGVFVVPRVGRVVLDAKSPIVWQAVEIPSHA